MNLFDGPDPLETTSTEVKNRILKPGQTLRAIDTGALYYGDKDGRPTAFVGASTSSSGGIGNILVGEKSAGIAQHVEPPPRNIVGIGMQRSIRTRCLAAQPPSGLRRFGKTKPRTRNRNPGPPSPPRRGGQHVSPQYGQNEKAASKRKIAVSPYNGSGLPDDLQAAPPIRLSGRNLTEIRRQRLRYISS